MNSRSIILILSILYLTTSINELFAQTLKRSSTNLEYGAHRLGRRNDDVMMKWRNYGLGQFIHWGLYAIPGGFWNGKYYPGAAEWIRSWDGMPNDAYDNLYKQFDPKKFDAEQWADMAQNMGSKYMIITTKHHDGFCLWPSKYTDYTIANTPYKKDLIQPLVDAYDNRGIDVYLYFSVMDWNHPGWRYQIESKEDSIAFESFKKFTRNQLLELLEKYPKAKGLWFDGTWDKAWVQQAAFCDELEKEMRAIHPGLIIGSRFRADENGKRHFDTNGDLMGDYEQGWERKIPNSIADTHDTDWDCVMTIPENIWGYHSEWRGHIKTTTELLEMMAKCISLDGNFVPNFGPNKEGTFRSEEVKIAKEIGAWMKMNGEAIYDCGYTPLEKQDWGYYTLNRKTNQLNMVVFNFPTSGKLRVKVPVAHELINAFGLNNKNKKLRIEEINQDNYFIHLEGPNPTQPTVYVIELKKLEFNTKTGKYEKAKT